MPKYLVETISMFRIRYVIEAESSEHVNDEVIMNDGNLAEFSQVHIDETITSTREINTEEYLRLFNEDNDYLKEWSDDQKLYYVNVIDSAKPNPELKEIDPSQRDWEYSGTGVKVWKGTMTVYDRP